MSSSVPLITVLEGSDMTPLSDMSIPLPYALDPTYVPYNQADGRVFYRKYQAPNQYEITGVELLKPK